MSGHVDIMKNCWEFTGCGRELAGKNANTLGVCPVYYEKKTDGFNRGKNGGRACWAIAGTFCNGEVQGIFVEKYNDCTKCEFYKKVLIEEGDNFTYTSDILNALSNEDG